MARCGCASECVCTVVGSGCVTVGGSGSTGAPYTVGLSVDPAVDNLVECAAGGLLATVVVGDTACIELTGAGTALSPIVASPVIDPDPLNTLTCGEDGLLVTSEIPALFVGDTDCIDLFGAGTFASPLFAQPIIDPAEGNILTCGVDGLMAGGEGLIDFLTALAAAGNIADVNAAATAYLTALGL